MVSVLRAFEHAGLEYVLNGATAMGFHGVIRATEDVDILIQASAENVERLRAAFRDVYGPDPHVEEIYWGCTPLYATTPRPATSTSTC